VDPHPLPPSNFSPPLPAQDFPVQDNSAAACEEGNWENNNQQVEIQEEHLEDNLNAQMNDI
jgi:hypothetical protein